MARKIGIAEQVERTVANAPSRHVEAHHRRSTNQTANAGTRHGDGWRRNHYDQLLLESATRLGALSIRQAARHIYPHLAYSTVRRRIGMMIQAGLLERIDTVPWAGVVVFPTALGRRAGVTDEHSPLRKPEPPADSTMLHRLLATEYALTYIAQGFNIITEREARMFETGAAILEPDDRDQFLHDRGVVRSDGVSRGVVPSPDEVGNMRVERWLTLPMKDASTHVRIPDFLVVTKHGELRSIEVEPTMKSNSRARGILTGYRDHCLQHNPVPHGIEQSLKEAGAKRGQFTSVQWIVSEAVDQQFRGHPSGTNPITGKPDKGLVREVWDSNPHTRLFFRDENTWGLHHGGWPISVSSLDVSFDEGMEYALSQRNLPSAYRTSMASWKVWRTLWNKDMAGEDNPVPFTQWLRAPGVLADCRRRAA